jgi:shikimate dehydrogenase
MTDRYAVIGNPIAHSRSPDIHALFACEFGCDLSYTRLLAPLGQFRETVESLRTGGARGANVTVPFKFEAFQYATTLTARARQSGAVNTLTFEGHSVVGDNTDGVGLTRDILVNLGVALAGARVLLVGAGGAAYGVVGALVDAEPATLAITNRTEVKATDLAAKYLHADVRALPPSALAREQFDVVINATSASLSDALPLVPPACFAPSALAYDMVYGKGQTAFLGVAASAGARTADGVGMLAEQAAEAFFVWRGVRPNTGPVIRMLKGG